MFISFILHKIIDSIEYSKTDGKSKEEAKKLKEEKMWAEYEDQLLEYYLNAPDDENTSKTKKLINEIKFHYEIRQVILPLLVPLLIGLVEFLHALFRLIEIIAKGD